jgi:hypothetical protein
MGWATNAPFLNRNRSHLLVRHIDCSGAVHANLAAHGAAGVGWGVPWCQFSVLHRSHPEASLALTLGLDLAVGSGVP